MLPTLLKDKFRKVIDMGLMQRISESRTAFISAFAGAAMTLGVGGAALAQDSSQVAAVPSANLPGKDVILRIGPGFSPSAADSIARVLRSEGCPATVTAERGFPKSLTVEVGDFSYKFRDGQVGSAGNKALDWCLERS
jgi:hypothetical protein